MTKKDDEFEALLRTVRPVGPSADLRARILAAKPGPAAWPWAAAAAALLLTIAGLQWSAGGLRHGIRPAAAAAAAEAPDIVMLRETLQLNDTEVRAMALKRDFDRIMAAEAPQPGVQP